MGGGLMPDYETTCLRPENANCRVQAAAFKRGAEWALDLARSTIDYQSQGPVAPSVDWPRVRAEMARRFGDV